MNRKERRTAESIARKNKTTNDNESIDAMGIGGWDDLNRLHQECNAVSITPSQLLPMLRDPSQIEKVDDKEKLISAAKVLSRDVVDYKNKLNEIYQMHSDRSGNCQSPDEVMSCINIGELYQNWLYSYQTVVLPTQILILDLFERGKEGPAKEVEGEFIPAGS